MMQGGRANHVNALMDRKVVEAYSVSLSLSLALFFSQTLFVTFSLFLSISPSVYICVHLSTASVVAVAVGVVVQ